MKTVIVLAALVVLAISGTVPEQQWKTKSVDAAFVEKQKKILSFFYNVKQVDTSAPWFKIGTDFDIESEVENFTDKAAVEDFLNYWKSGYMPKYHVFSVFAEKQREEAIALFKLFFYAKDFETFYKTAAFAKVNLNEGLFTYAYYIALLQRPDTMGFILPAPYEVYPEMFMNSNTYFNIQRTEEQGGIHFPEIAAKYGIIKENEDYVYYANYSSALTYPNAEQRLSYFTEDIGLNSYYFYYHAQLPFWFKTEKYKGLKTSRGEFYFYFYQQLLARYYLERLSNGLGEIPTFSWFSPIRVGYYPNMVTEYYPFSQRSNNYNIHTEKNYEAIRFLDIFEKTFFQYIQKGHFKAFNQKVDFHDPKAMNFVGNYWQTNANLFGEKYTETYERSYEVTARRVLGGAPERFDKYNFMPSALDFYQTSLRDPAFYQLYNKIFDNMVHYKQFLHPYTYEDLHYVGVKINDVKIDKLETYFELYDFDATNTIFFKLDEHSPKYVPRVRQPRINHKPFTVSIDAKSDEESEAIFKIYIGPKYDSNGYPITLEHNWMNFFELDWFVHKLSPGVNKIERSSEEFFYFKEDPIPSSKVWNLLAEGKVPSYMTDGFDLKPRRIMLPKGTKGGFPYQIFVFVFPNNSVYKDVGKRKVDLFKILLSQKSLGYPFDRPLNEQYFKQPNMFFEDVHIYHEGEEHPYMYANPEHKLNKPW